MKFGRLKLPMSEKCRESLVLMQWISKEKLIKALANEYWWENILKLLSKQHNKIDWEKQSNNLPRRHVLFW